MISEVTIALGAQSVSGLLQRPSRAPLAAFVLAHGAGAGMTHPFMEAVASGLAARGIATLRFNFPFAEKRSERPDSAPLAKQVVRCAVAEAERLLPGVPLFAGGKSFGGRMTSQAQAEAPLASVRGLVFFGFPLHPAGRPSSARADHLPDVCIPMLFVGGDRDALAELVLLRQVICRLQDRAELHVVADGDHSFHVRRMSGRSSEEALSGALDKVAGWFATQLAIA